MRKLIILNALFLSALVALKSQAQDGTYNKDFGSVLSPGTFMFGSSLNTIDKLSSVVVQPDGKIIVGGVSKVGILIPQDKFYINRFLSDGSVDKTFNGGSERAISDSCSTLGVFIAQRTDGSILYAGGRGPYKLPMVGRLNLDGSDLIAPIGNFNVSTPLNQHYVSSMSYNKTNDKMTVGGYLLNMLQYSFGLKFNPLCALDKTFGGTGKVYVGSSPTPPWLSTTKAVLNLDDGSTLLACDTASGGGYYALVKLKPNGTFDSKFGNGNGVARIYLGPTFTSGSISGMALMPNGQIMVCGNAGNNFAVFRVNANGTKDNTFNAIPFSYGGTGEAFSSVLVQPDKKIIVSGYSTASFPTTTTGIIARYLQNGNLDSTFGIDGKVIVSTPMTINASALSTFDKSAVFVGKAYSTKQMIIIKLYYDAQKLNILGKDIVSVSTENLYNVHPYIASDKLVYNWSYSSPNIYTSNSITGDSITLFFKKDTPSGILTCVIKTQSGITLKTLTKKITVNPEPTLSEMLVETNCGLTQTRCSASYIKSFNIDSDVALTDNGCSPTGYYDYTSASNYDTLLVGDNYQGYIGYNGKGIAYAAAWIDFNNDGKLSDTKEFVGSSYSDTGNLTITNIQIPSETELGPKRMRVRVRPTAAFTAIDFCPTNDEEGETEDYLVVINKYEGIKTPNFITPNGDGRNDFFVVRGAVSNSDNSLKVFNRIGDLVYSENNYDNNWSGKDQGGNPLKPGTYYYVFTQKNSGKDKEVAVKGFLEVRY